MDNNSIEKSWDYLCHFGILGMKWGIRRYQNPDGSLTPEGRARYGYGAARAVAPDGKGGYYYATKPGEGPRNDLVTNPEEAKKGWKAIASSKSGKPVAVAPDGKGGYYYATKPGEGPRNDLVTNPEEAKKDGKL